MNNEILIGIAGLVLSVLTYFAGVWRAERRQAKQDKGQRTDRVFNAYMDIRNRNKTAGHDGLLKSGVATLSSDAEIRELADRIMDYGEKDPLERKSGLIDNVDLKMLFKYAAKERINFLRVQLADVIEQSKSKIIE